MKLLRRKPGRPEGRSEEKASFAAQSRHVRTGQGRTAHLDHPVIGILCGWKSAEWTEAAPSLPVCRMCEDESAKLSGQVTA